jgi:hypothetical protein
MAKDPAIRAHEDWIGLVQPVGLVVSPVALVNAQAIADKNVKVEQEALRRLVDASVEFDRRSGREAAPRIESLRDFVTAVLGWQESDLGNDVDAFNVALEDYGETLRVTHVVRTSDKPDAAPLLLIKVLPTGTDYDDSKHYKERLWQASAQARFERILWEHNVPAGLLWNGTSLRLVYVPRGETSGHITFPLAAMCEVSNRPMLSALKLLLSPERLWTLPAKQRLPTILEESRRYQNQVSTELAEQVLGALAELLKGFQAADEHARGALLGEVLREDPDEVYGGLLSVLLRLVFILYSEDRSLLPDDDLYRDGYSVTRLFERLREDVALNPDTMDLRFGAWGQLVALFRLIHDGGAYRNENGESVKLPKRERQLFNPDTYAFLEGRRWKVMRQEKAPIPRVSDGVVYRVLERLLLLDGQRLSYRTLDVEQIGSVYEGLMGFRLERADGQSIGVRPQHVVIDLKRLLEQKPAERAKWLKETAACDLAAKAATALKEAKSVDDAVTALGSKVSPRTPGLMPAGSLYLQPTDERRRSGSHYTPRALTRPIVETALRPIFERLADEAKDKKKGPTPDQILDLKICDPAMGSGAFLVEACRQVGEKLVDAWTRHNEYPDVPPDEAPLLHAMRKVATRCLYGVDKNRFAVELAKLSLWLATLAKDHPFTFVDHTLRCGDSLVGLSRAQIAGFSWEPEPARIYASQWIEDAIQEALIERRTIGSLGDTTDNHEKALALKRAEDDISSVRLIGDAAIAAFFSSTKPKDQQAERDRLLAVVLAWQKDRAGFQSLLDAQAILHQGERGVTPFHWEIEFPEVFSRTRPGFDICAGNPPFLGGTRVSTEIGMTYFEWLTGRYPPAGHLCDLVAYFFRQAFRLVRDQGALGFLATNTIAQGDTRQGGLEQILAEGGVIFSARRRFRWPGLAAVMVSIVHITKRPRGTLQVLLDGSVVRRISSFLWEGSVDSAPARLENRLFSLGSKIYGQGFLFDDADTAANPLAALSALRLGNADEARRVFPYIGGEEVTTDPEQQPDRWAIYLSDLKEEAELAPFPNLRRIVHDKVRPERERLGDNPNNVPLKRRWWAYQAHRPELYAALRPLPRCLVVPRVAHSLVFAWQPTDRIFSEQLVVFAISEDAGFAALQARPHEIWTRFFASTLEDRLRYTPSDCYETFPFPPGWESIGPLREIGAQYNAFRAALMTRQGEGLTKTYNRFHDPEHDGSGVDGRDPTDVITDIVELRRLHDEMDRAILDAYGWTDIKPTCEFLLDYEVEDDDEEGGKRKKKKPWRYRWPDEVRDEVLARLLELNRQRAEEERLLGAEAATKVEAAPGFALEAPKVKKPAKKAKAT